MISSTSVHRAFSPKRLAVALGVSESSIKRWIDSGLISVSKTAGGHRRVPLHAVIRFVRDQGMEVVHPEALGLPGSGPSTTIDPGHVTTDQLVDVLTSHRAELAQGVIVNAYVAGTPLHELFDGPIREALDRIGMQWHAGPRGIVTEHRSTQVIVQTLSHLRALLPPADDDAAVAIGCAPTADVYLLPSLMADVILADVGFQEINLGPDTPFEALAAAVEESHPLLVWLSLSSHPNTGEIADGIRQIRTLSPQTHVLFGGRSAGLVESMGDPLVRRLSSMQELHVVAGKIFNGTLD